MGKRGLTVLLVSVAILLALLGGGIWWYLSVPHTPEAQFALAEKLEKDLRAQAVTKTPTELAPKVEQTAEQYRRVGSRFGSSPKAAEAAKRIARIYEEVARDNQRAMTTLEQLGKEYPDEDNAGYALLEEARLIRLQAKSLKASGSPEAEARFKDALAKLEDFRKTYDKSKKGDAALMEIGRIWQDDLETPPIHAIETFTQVLKDYPHSEYEPEAMYRLALEYERVKEYERALALYSELLEQYPKSKFAADATFNRGKLLADKMDKHDEAAKEFEKMAQEFPDDQRAGMASQEARSEKTKAAQAEGEKYGKARYGGSVPFDTSGDKPLPPAEMLKQFTAQKLDAENYDLNVTFEPKDHRISVQGTLKLANRGDEKKSLLLMLGPGLDVSKLTVDGAVAQTQHKGETLLIALPAALAKDAQTTLGFTYSGLYADASMMQGFQPGVGGGLRGSRPPAVPDAGPTGKLRGKPAPDLHLKTLDGKEVSLADQKGKVVVIDFWATWCPPCRESLPHLQKLSEDAALKQQGLVVWGVDAQEKTEDIQKYMTENKLDFTVPLDADGKAMQDYLVQGIPTTVIIGRDGVLRDAFVGWDAADGGKAMEEAIKKALSNEADGREAAKPTLTYEPQMAIGEYGYGLFGASWYPVTIIGDVFDAHVILNTPADMEAVSNGAVVKREKSTQPGVEGHFEFQTKNPVFGLYFAYGPFVVQDKQVGAIHFYTYLHPENAPKHDAYVDVTNRILSFYSSKFAPFPYEKMAIIEAPLPPFLGGVGPSSLMFLQENMVAHPEVPENLLAHELAHQWFGNLIPVNLIDPGYNQWLSEGFATYCDALYTEYKDGPKAFLLHIEQYQQLYFQFAMLSPKGAGAIKDTLSPMSAMYRPVVYEKGALVLHMLRKVMGDEKFFRLMRQFVETYRNKPTTTDDFRKMASDINGEDLSWFFAEWYDQAVFAHWKVAADVKPDGAGADTHVTITQPDDLVKMPADVTFIGDKDERQVVKDVMLDKKENLVDAKTPFVPVRVVVDEDHWILRRLGKDNEWTSEKAAPATAGK